MQLRQLCAFNIMVIMSYVISTFLDMLILYSYLRHARKLSNKATQMVVNNLNQSFSSKSDEVQERLTVSRKLSVYKELADEQIRKVIVSMLTLKVVDESILESSMTVTENTANDSLLERRDSLVLF
mmetsp:Transcript_35886/g.43870  ORF Transcript_35886/g.43870 Transcript_35886/m.43870 type:complete len:126 (+) Transcript_35886:759-1136(+)